MIFSSQTENVLIKVMVGKINRQQQQQQQRQRQQQQRQRQRHQQQPHRKVGSILF